MKKLHFAVLLFLSAFTLKASPPTHGLNAQYTGDKLSITPQDAAQHWAFSLTVKRVGSYKPSAQPFVTRHENKVQFNHEHHFTVEYINNEEGISQRFIIEKPQTKLSVQLQPESGWTAMYQSETGLTFNNNGQQIFYGDLKVVDAKGNKLPAHFKVQQNIVEIAVDAEHAVYPVSIRTTGIGGQMYTSQAKSLLQNNQAGSFLGSVVAGGGDINGDGKDDVIVSAPNFSNSESQEGAVYVYYGSSPNGINPGTATRLEINVANAHFGTHVAGGGDVNGDGNDDIVVGVPNSTGVGAVYVYYGSPAGITTTPVIISSEQSGDYFGSSVDIVGHMDGDETDEIIVGASNGAGYAWVIFGSIWGIDNGGITVLSVSGTTGFGAKVSDAGDVDGSGGNDVMVSAGEDVYIFFSGAAGVSTTPSQIILRPADAAGFGSALAGGGDVNGDGYDDIVVGAKDYVDLEEGGVQSGAIYVFLGSDTGLVATPNRIISAARYLWPQRSGSLFGTQVSFAGDVDNDGFDDVIAGLPRGEYDDPSQTDEGIVWLIYGFDRGLHLGPDATIECNQANAWLGSSVAGAGDVNGDGYDDLIMGAQQYDNGHLNEGVAWVFLGDYYASGRMAAPVAKDSLLTTKLSALVKTFPNPVVNNLSVQFEGLNTGTNTSVQLLNAYGVPVKTIQLGRVDKGNEMIDVSTLVPGTYFLMINNGTKVIREKIIKQ